MQKIIAHTSVLSIFCIFLSACGFSGGEQKAPPTSVSTPSKTSTAIPTSTPKPTTTPTPTHTLTPTSVLPSILTIMAPVGSKKGVSEAAAHDLNKPGPHRIVLLTESGSAHEWNEALPADWLPTSVSETELVVMVGPEKETALGSAYYKNGNQNVRVFRYRFDLLIEVREAQTGRTIKTDKIAGPEPIEFPRSLPSSKTRIDGKHVDYREFEAWLTCKVVLSGVCEMRKLTTKGLNSSANSVAISPDGRLLASGLNDGDVFLWQISNGVVQRVLSADTFAFLRPVPAKSVSFSPDGQILASGSQDGSVLLWKVSDGTLLHRMKMHKDSVNSVTFSPDGESLASGSADTTIRLWKTSNGASFRTLKGHEDSVNSVAFSPDGETLLSWSQDGSVRVWQISDGTLLLTEKLDHPSADGVVFSSNGETLASWSSDGMIRLWRISDKALAKTQEVIHPSVNSVAFSPDGETLVSGSTDRSVQLWRVSDGTVLLKLWGQSASVNSVVLSPNGKTLATGGSDGNVFLWLIR